jgi:hypothetical protein
LKILMRYISAAVLAAFLLPSALAQKINLPTQVRGNLPAANLPSGGTWSTPSAMGGNLDMKTNNLLQEGPNCAAGTVLNELVKWSSAAGVPCLTVTGANETNTAIGVCVNSTLGTCGNSGTATYSASGNASCIFDNATTVNDFVQQSVTAGQCDDTGSSTTVPSGVEIIGRVQSTNGGAGTYVVNVGATLDVVGGGGAGNLPAISSGTKGKPLTNAGVTSSWGASELDAAQFTGADIVLQINACLTAGGVGAVCNARGISTNLTTSTTLAVGNTQTVLLPGRTITTSANPATTVTTGSQLIGMGDYKSVILTTASGATALRAACYSSCTNGTVAGVTVQGIQFSANVVNTGIGIDFSSIDRSHFYSLQITGYHDGTWNSLDCSTVGCYYNTFFDIRWNGTPGSNGFHATFSANANKVIASSFQNGTNQFLVGGNPTGSLTNSNVNEISCTDCTFESETLIPKPAAPTSACTAGAVTMFYQMTWVSDGGQTQPSTEASRASCADQAASLALTPPAAPAGATGYLVYASGAAGTGAETLQPATGDCATLTVNGTVVCQPAAVWTQAAVLATTKASPPKYNVSGASMDIIRGTGIKFAGMTRCEEGNFTADTTRCFLSISDAGAGPTAIDAIHIQSTSLPPIIDQAGMSSFLGGGNQFDQQTKGTSDSAGANLIPNASFEGWNGVNNVLGWSTVNGTNWDTNTGCTAPASCVSQNTATVNQGTYSAQLGDTTSAPANRGINTTDKIAIDPAHSYTLSYNISMPTDATTPKYDIGFKFYDTTGTLITDSGISFQPPMSIAVLPGGSISSSNGPYTASSLFYTANCNCFASSDYTVTTAGTMQRVTHIIKFPERIGYKRVAWVRLGFFRATNVTTAANGIMQLDDVYFAQGAVAWEPGAVDGGQAGGNPHYLATLLDSGNGGVTKAYSILKGSNTLTLTADSSSVVATTAATAVTLFSWLGLPPGTYAYHCGVNYIQSTGNAAIGVAVQGATNAPTNMSASAIVATSASAIGAANSGNITTTTYTSVAAPTGAAFGTVLPISIDGAIEVGALPSTLNIGFYSGSASDGIVLKRDSACSIRP